MATYLDLFRYRELFGSLFRRDLRAKYKGSFLGLAWSLLHPLLLMAVYLLVFSVLWRITEVGSDDPLEFLERAVEFANNRLWGTLTADLVIRGVKKR